MKNTTLTIKGEGRNLITVELIDKDKINFQYEIDKKIESQDNPILVTSKIILNKQSALKIADFIKSIL